MVDFVQTEGTQGHPKSGKHIVAAIQNEAALYVNDGMHDGKENVDKQQPEYLFPLFVSSIICGCLLLGFS